MLADADDQRHPNSFIRKGGIDFFFSGTLLTWKSCSTEGRKLEKCKTTLFFFFFFVDVLTVGSLNKLVNFRDHLSLPKRARRRPNLTRLPRQKYFEDYSTFFLKKMARVQKPPANQSRFVSRQQLANE